MYIISVIPIKRGIPFSTLTYYSSDLLPVGTIVQIPLGKQSIHGVVYDGVPLIEAKSTIKNASFSLKKIKAVVGISAYSRAIVSGLVEASTKMMAPIGAIAGVALNELFFDFFYNTEEVVLSERSSVKKPRVVYGAIEERIDEYKRIIRGAFAQKESVVLVCPSVRGAQQWYQALQKGITAHSVLLHSKQTKRDQKSALSAIKQSPRPLFICVTPAFATIPRSDVSTLIVEDESSSFYITQDRYEIDMRVVLDAIARASATTIVYGDILPRFETLQNTDSVHLARSFTPEKLVVVPTEPYRTILPTETIELIRYCQKNKKTLFIYTNRKGIAPLSRCADCGTTVDCPTCGLPIVLRYKTVDGERQRLFICTACGDTLPPTHTCSYCGGWNITPVPVGTESIREAVASITDPETIITVDDDITPDSKQIETLLETAKKQRRFIMIGTQKILPFLKQVDFIVIPFFDRILSVASPYTVEETLRLVMVCNEKTKDTLILCTKKPDFLLTKQLATKKIQEIISDDMEARQTLHYPPFGTLLKLSLTIPSAQVHTISQKVEVFFAGTEISMLPARRISPGSMKVLCVWIIQGEISYIEEHRDELQTFVEELRFPYKLTINPSRF